jgi:hypothetical protein
MVFASTMTTNMTRMATAVKNVHAQECRFSVKYQGQAFDLIDARAVRRAMREEPPLVAFQELPQYSRRQDSPGCNGAGITKVLAHRALPSCPEFCAAAVE